MKRRKPIPPRRSGDDDDDCVNDCLGVGSYTGEMPVERTRMELDNLKLMEPIGFVHFPLEAKCPAAKSRISKKAGRSRSASNSKRSKRSKKSE